MYKQVYTNVDIAYAVSALETTYAVSALERF